MKLKKKTSQTMEDRHDFYVPDCKWFETLLTSEKVHKTTYQRCRRRWTELFVRQGYRDTKELRRVSLKFRTLVNSALFKPVRPRF